MGRWRSLQQLRADYAASGLELAKKHPQCRGKLRYAAQVDADQHCADLRSNDANEHWVRRAQLIVYHCRWCDGYHVGHDRRQRPRR